MTPASLGLTAIIALLVIIFLLRIPVGFAMALLGFLGFRQMLGWQPAVSMVGSEAWNVFNSYGLTVIPLFILMGQICFHSGVNQRLYRTAYVWMGQIRGGIAMATAMACAGFAAICGSNTATAATMSSVALPEMKKYGYHDTLSTGTVAAGATLGVLIPPSVVLILIGLQTGLSIARLFWAAVLPGLALLLALLLTISIYCRLRPDHAPAGEKTTFKQKIRSLPGSIEMLVLFALVMGGLMVGFFTPSEAGAAGSALALLIAVAGGRMNMEKLKRSLADTLRVSCMIMVIVLGAVIFGRFLALTRLPFEIAQTVAGLDLSPAVIIAIICAIYALGGAIMDALALLIITIPIFFPVAESLGYDPVWFSVVITIVTTMGAITPPVGVNTFIVASMSKDISMGKVFKGVLIFIPGYVLCLALLLLWPQLALWLPALVR